MVVTRYDPQRMMALLLSVGTVREAMVQMAAALNRIKFNIFLSGVSFIGILCLTLMHFFKNLSLKFDFNHQTFRPTVADKLGIQTRSE